MEPSKPVSKSLTLSFEVWRQNDYGNQFLIKAFADAERAEQLVALLE